ncbi:MAG: TlpA family protein disulfide reductase, partial [Planctomycetota bacterium]
MIWMRRLFEGAWRRKVLGLAVVTAGVFWWSPAEALAGEVPDSYYFYGEKRPAPLRKLEGQKAPALRTQSWLGDPQKLRDLRGRVVVIDFWATWCGPCVKALPKNVQLVDKYGDAGLTVIGVHDSNRGKERMAAVAESRKINYPLAVDARGGPSARDYKVQFWPTYVVVDKWGTVRAAGLQPNRIEDVVKKLL